MNYKNKSNAVVGVCLLLVLFYVMPCQTVNADGTFVTEEEASFGGDGSDDNVLKEESRPQQPVQLTEEVASEVFPREDVTRGKTPETSDKEEKTEPVKAESQQQGEHTISQNSTAAVFHVPVRRPDTENGRKKVEKSIQEESLREESEVKEEVSKKAEKNIEEQPRQKEPWWLLAVGGFLLLCGCIRILWRIKSRQE